MSDTVIRLEGLSKQYRIVTRSEAYETLFNTLSDALASPFRWAGKLLRGQVASAAEIDEKFWALRDVSFEVKRGDVVGIIGRNGAGKSTLLKILARITEPTEGYAEIRGRVGSLLEVGTGFHHELTGRENIYLNGAILGMKKAEIDRKFDEIVAFSEIERFLDTPVKYYSSGMHVRLAFAVAAHIDPEILIVDEVLAVGDSAFQKKCLGKIGEVSRGGRTVLFVSHNMATVENLCTKGIVLQEGRLALCGGVKEVIDHYLLNISADGQGSKFPIVDLSAAPGRPSGCRPLLKRLELFNGDGRPLGEGLPMGATLKAHVYFQLEHATSNFDVGLGFNSLLGQRVFTAHSAFERQREWNEGVGEQLLVCEIPSLTLVPGEYRIKVGLYINNVQVDFVEDATRLTMVESDYYGTGKVPWNGTFVLGHKWYIGRSEDETKSTQSPRWHVEAER